MKRFLIILAVAVAAAACVKSEVGNNGSISFQTASLLSKAGITGTEFPQSESFGVYAWSAGTIGEYFMDNETVSYDTEDKQWKPSTTYYWPKNATVDFISFYPAGLSGLKVEPDKLTFTDVNVWNSQQDILYADKAAGFSDNSGLVSQQLNASDGVPTIFRHALSKIKVKVVLAYSHKEDPDGTVYDWDVTLNSLTLSGIKTSGSAVLNLAATPTEGIITWEKPANEVWTPGSAVNTPANYLAIPQQMTALKAIDIVGETFVVPQPLATGGQKANLNFSVKTTRNGQPFLNEPNIQVSVDLISPDIPSWKMNHSVSYTLNICPAGERELKPITFDPSLVQWENDYVTTVVDLGL